MSVPAVPRQGARVDVAVPFHLEGRRPLANFRVVQDALQVRHEARGLGVGEALVELALVHRAPHGVVVQVELLQGVPLEDAARVEGCSPLQILWKVYVPLARPTYVAYGLVSVSYHWNNFLWPLIITNSVSTRPLTVGLAIFGAPESGVDWSIITAGTLLAVAPLLVAFLLFQRQFVQSFMHAGIK